MTTTVAKPVADRSVRRGLRHHLRTLHVIAAAEFKLKYTGSALGYVWSILKPLLLFLMLYAVFGKVFKLGSISPYYPLALLTGIVLFYFFSDATTLGMNSLVTRESLLRKLSFPRLIIPTAATLTAALTFATNATVLAVIVAYKGIVPQLNWLLIPLLLLELYIFTLGVSLILATLFVRLRDLGQLWELFLQLFFYASPIVYPIGFLPPWARQIVFLNPFTQVLQDIRAIVIYPDVPNDKITASAALAGVGGHLLPVSIAICTFVFGVVYLKREEPWFAERV
jgi:ABC-2 type transport system permease protein